LKKQQGILKASKRFFKSPDEVDYTFALKNLSTRNTKYAGQRRKMVLSSILTVAAGMQAGLILVLPIQLVLILLKP
jgi:hypothetical protein